MQPAVSNVLLIGQRSMSRAGFQNWRNVRLEKFSLVSFLVLTAVNRLHLVGKKKNVQLSCTVQSRGWHQACWVSEKVPIGKELLIRAYNEGIWRKKIDTQS